MLFPTLFFLFAVGVAVGEEEGCREQMFEKCNVNNAPKYIPDKMEDLKRDMVVLQNAVKCLVEESETCNIDGVFDMIYFRKFSEFVEANNNEESPLYQALSRNYECIHPILRDMGGDHCFRSEVDSKEMADSLSKVGELPEAIDYCKYALYEITCVAHIIGKQCGQEAKDTVTEIMQNVRGDFVHCNDESTSSQLQPYKEIFEEAVAKAVDGEA